VSLNSWPYFLHVHRINRENILPLSLQVRGQLEFLRALLYLEEDKDFGRVFMADEHNSQNVAAAPAVRMVKCVKLGRELPGLDRLPWKGPIGQRVYDNVSKEAWKGWVEHSKMLMNEFRLNPLDPKSQQIMEEQMESYFFGDGAKAPEGYVPPKH
jgi:Fe-S cluster biosynthesis and repair protein YggX